MRGRGWSVAAAVADADADAVDEVEVFVVDGAVVDSVWCWRGWRHT